MSQNDQPLKKALVQAIGEVADDPAAYFSKVRESERIISTKKARIAYLQNTVLSITQAIKPVVVYTGPSDKVGECTSEILDLIEEIKEEASRWVSLQKECACILSILLPDADQRDLLEAYYLSGESWECVARGRGITYRWVMTLRRQALLTVQENARIYLEKLPKK